MHPENELILYHYGELSPEKARDLLAHLDTCAECRGRLEMMREASACVNEPAIEPPRTVLDGLKAAAREKAAEIVPAVPPERKGARIFPRFGWAFAGALASILAVSVYFTGREGSRSSEMEDSRLSLESSGSRSPSPKAEDSRLSLESSGSRSPSPKAEDAGQFAWEGSMEEEIESLDCELAEFRMESESVYAWSGFDLEYSGIESEEDSIENSIRWREL